MPTHTSRRSFSSFSSTFTGGRAPREPVFLTEARGHRAPEDVVFQEMGAKPAPFAAERGAIRAIAPATAPEVLLPPAPPPIPAGPSPAQIEFSERVAAAVGAMRLTTERLAEQVRSDVLEIALLVARRIVETELTTNVEPLFSMIRSVVRRAGESRRLIVHLCPDDAARVESASGGKGIPGIAVAQIEIHADATMSAGDCVVEADFGVVDGRIDTRMDELRRILADVITGAAGQPGTER